MDFLKTSSRISSRIPLGILPKIAPGIPPKSYTLFKDPSTPVRISPWISAKIHHSIPSRNPLIILPNIPSIISSRIPIRIRLTLSSENPWKTPVWLPLRASSGIPSRISQDFCYETLLKYFQRFFFELLQRIFQKFLVQTFLQGFPQGFIKN